MAGGDGLERIFERATARDVSEGGRQNTPGVRLGLAARRGDRGALVYGDDLDRFA